jgi:2,3-bisphosphoglycerate-independent phosphoglycerate mutase
LAQNPSDIARVLTDFVGHNEGFIAVLLQLSQLRRNFAVGNMNGAGNVAGIELGLITHIQQHPGLIIEHTRHFMGGNGATIFNPLTPGVDEDQRGQDRDQQPLLSQKYDEIHWLAFRLEPLDRWRAGEAPRARAAVYTKEPAFLSFRHRVTYANTLECGCFTVVAPPFGWKPPFDSPDLEVTLSMTATKKPIVLLILDGFGYSENTEHNAIYSANTPVWDRVWANNPKNLIETSGMAVGLPEGQMGNSEVGHMTIGAGRVVYQSFTRINKAITDGDFFENPAYVAAIDKAVSAGKAVHILGLLSEGGVHSHQDHIYAMMKMAAQRGAKEIYLHAFLDGRDTAPRSAKASLEKAEQLFRELGVGRVATLCGRYFAMDRDNRWDRVQACYDAMVTGSSEFDAESSVAGLEAAYARDENDEFVKPTVIAAEGEEVATINDGDSVIFMNFRPDRAREITRALVETDFDGFQRELHPELAEFVMTTEYAADIKANCAFPPQEMINSFGDYLAQQGKTQLRIAETEKYAHVTFFFNGGTEDKFAGEDRILVPSPNVATYDLKPEMSAPEVTDKLVDAIKSGKYDAIICNYANGDMVGHSGIFEAAVKAVEAVDACVGRVLEAAEEVGGEVLITADHGNVEEMFDPESGQVSTQHSTLPVPLVYCGPRQGRILDGGSLADLAPTMLKLMNLAQPAEMTGRNLFEAS